MRMTEDSEEGSWSGETRSGAADGEKLGDAQMRLRMR